MSEEEYFLHLDFLFHSHSAVSQNFFLCSFIFSLSLSLTFSCLQLNCFLCRLPNSLNEGDISGTSGLIAGTRQLISMRGADIWEDSVTL